jgi:splicing factor 3B subunit 2
MNASNNRRLTKNEKKRLKKKCCHEESDENKDINNIHQEQNATVMRENGQKNSRLDFNSFEIEYVAADPAVLIGEDPSVLEAFEGVFNRFAKPEELLSDKPRFLISADEENDSNITDIVPQDGDESNVADSKKLSKKKKKLLSRLSVAELKQLVLRPDVVEAHDVTSSDPRLLVLLKSTRNTVQVPRHWCHVRKYLQGKRGIEKVPYQLPEFIAETGIAKIRDALLEQEALKKGKQKARERIRPKMGRIDIDYQVLHDAFFKYQTKPKLTLQGDIYYEGKEFEVLFF